MNAPAPKLTNSPSSHSQLVPTGAESQVRSYSLISIHANFPNTVSATTGAGWGGCTVSLVDESQVDAFIARIKAGYGPYRDLEGEALQEVIFATKPSSGVCGTSIQFLSVPLRLISLSATVYKFTE